MNFPPIQVAVRLGRKILPWGAAALFLGSATLVWLYLGNDFRWVLFDQPLALNPGAETSGAFSAEIDEHCEIEIEFDRAAIAAFPGLNEAVNELYKPAALDIRWRVTADGETGENMIAQGDARDYLYVRSSNPNPVAQLAFAMLNLSASKGDPGRVGRGMGRFPCRAGRSYRVQASVGSEQTPAQAIEANVKVKLDRVFATRRQQRSLPFFWLSAALIAFGVLGLALTFVSKLLPT